MRVLFDTDVVLDMILEREPFVEEAAALFESHGRGQIDGFVSGVTLVNVFYITRKSKGLDGARRAVEELLGTLDVCPMDWTVMDDEIGRAHV